MKMGKSKTYKNYLEPLKILVFKSKKDLKNYIKDVSNQNVSETKNKCDITMLETIQKTREYLDYIERHYNNVQKAWKLLNDKCPNHFKFIHDDYVWGMINQNVINHDISKLSAEEFVQYREYFYPTKDEVKDKESMNKAWEHHKENNPHHWQNWTVKFKEHPYVEIFFIENIVDWVAMGFEFGDTAKDYYEANKDKIDLPQWAIDYMYGIFSYIYPNK